MKYILLQVAVGGAVGAMLRYEFGRMATHLVGRGFPWGTLGVNIIGSFLMGVMVVVMAEKGGTRLAPLLMIGFLGGFTTFSSFSLDTVALMERGQHGLALAYVAASVAISLAALAIGMGLTRAAFS